MLSTSSRFTQTLDPTTGAARLRAAASATCAYPTTATAVTGFAGNAFGGSWTSIERKPMPVVDLHPDRWPLHSTS